MWDWAIFGLFALGLAAAVFCIYRLHLISGPKPKKDKNQPKKQSWNQQKSAIGQEIDRFLDTVSLPVFLLEPGIYHQQLQLLKFPNRSIDSRYESNQDMILNPFQGPVKSFLANLKKKGFYLQGYEEEFLNAMIRRIATRNYQSHLHELGDFLAEQQDFRSACEDLFSRLAVEPKLKVNPSFVAVLNSFYREPITFRSNYDKAAFNYALGMVDYWNRYLRQKGAIKALMTIKELSLKMEEIYPGKEV